MKKTIIALALSVSGCVFGKSADQNPARYQNNPLQQARQAAPAAAPQDPDGFMAGLGFYGGNNQALRAPAPANNNRRPAPDNDVENLRAQDPDGFMKSLGFY